MSEQQPSQPGRAHLLRLNTQTANSKHATNEKLSLNTELLTKAAGSATYILIREIQVKRPSLVGKAPKYRGHT